MSTSLLVLAAGKGTRMHSKLPKVLHKIAQQTFLDHIQSTCKAFEFNQQLLVCGHQGELIKESLQDNRMLVVEQTEQLGTAHAVGVALPHIQSERVLVWFGDVPLLGRTTVQALLDSPADSLALVTVKTPQPFGLGRILRDAQQQVHGIIEEKDASPEQRLIEEVCVGVFLFPKHLLVEALPKLSQQTAQRESYLTALIGQAYQQGMQIVAVQPQAAYEALGVNSKNQLANLERHFQAAQAERLMAQGLCLLSPERFDLRGTLSFESDVIIDANVILEGEVILREGVIIGPHVIIKNATIEAHAHIKAHSIIEGAVVERGAEVGPFARLRPGTRLGPKVRIGNFVEIKNATIEACSKVNHLSYVGDAHLGQRVNFGAGSITCNYDGRHKHHTEIEEDVSVGANCQLIAPIHIGRAATIAAGTTLSKDAPAGKLTINPLSQTVIEDWVPPKDRD